MFINNILPVLFLALSYVTGINRTGAVQSRYSDSGLNAIDTLKGNQVLYHGRVWRNKYSLISGGQYLYSKDFLTGSVSIGGRTFRDILIRYDIYNDEVMIPNYKGMILQLNKEMVDSFSVVYQNVNHRFINIPGDSVKGFTGFVNVLYSGKSALYVKYRKKIELLAVDNKYDKFYQTQQIFLIRDNSVDQFKGRIEFLRLLGEYRKPVRYFIKKNRLLVTKEKPESFIQVVQYYDSLRR